MVVLGASKLAIGVRDNSGIVYSLLTLSFYVQSSCIFISVFVTARFHWLTRN